MRLFVAGTRCCFACGGGTVSGHGHDLGGVFQDAESVGREGEGL